MVLELKDKLNLLRGDFIIASPPNSGVSWIMNILLELNICINVKNEHYEMISWKFESPNRGYLDEEEQDNWSTILPLLKRNKVVHFKENILFTITHNPPSLEDFIDNKKIILMVREPRDTFYSRYKRIYKDNEYSLNEFLKNPENIEFNFSDDTLNFWISTDDRNVFIPHPKPIFNIAYRWAIWCGLWIQCGRPDNLLIVRLEDTKSTPFELVKNILDFINISRTDEEIANAINESTFEKAKENEIAKSGDAKHFNSGKPTESLNHYSDESLLMFDGLPYIVMNYLGYSKFTNYNKNLPTFDSIIKELQVIKSPLIKKLLTILERIEKNTSLENIPEDFFRIYINFFAIKNKINFKIKLYIVETFLAIAMSIIYVSNDNAINFNNTKFSIIESNIFKALFVLFNQTPLKSMKHLLDKLNFELYSIIEFLEG